MDLLIVLVVCIVAVAFTGFVVWWASTITLGGFVAFMCVMTFLLSTAAILTSRSRRWPLYIACSIIWLGSLGALVYMSTMK